MHYTIQKVINKNPYLFSGGYDEDYVNKPVYMAKYDGCHRGEEIYFPKLKECKSWLNKINATYTRIK
jgi:hypothetical protein